MEPTIKPSVSSSAHNAKSIGPNFEFLPDADEIEQRPLPKFARITLPVMLLALLVAILWASFSEMDQIVLARGRLVNPRPNIVVQPLETSIVKKIEVQVGQVVKKGQILATMDPTFVQSDEAQLRSKLRSLNTQSEALNIEMAGGQSAQGHDADSVLQARLAHERKGNFQAQLSKIDENIARLRASLETNQKDQQVLSARLKSLLEIEAMQEKLVAQKYGARMHLLEAQDKRLEVERDQMLTKNREQEIRRELSGQESEKLAFNKGWRQKTVEDLLAISRERDGILEQLQKVDKRHELVNLTAPADAVVLEIGKFSPGTIVREAETFFTLVPLAAELEAEVQIDALDVGYIRNGAIAHVKLDAFPFQKHGDLAAEVRTISEDAFKREAAQGLDAFYLSNIALKSVQLKKMPSKARLIPGMTLSAEIVVGKRTVMSYLLWPLMKSVDESMREP